MRETFVFYRSFYEALNEMSEEDYCITTRAIFEYALNGIESKLTGVPKIVFALVKPQIDASNNRYDACVENGKKGGRPKKNQTKNQSKNQNGLEEKNLNKNINNNENHNKECSSSSYRCDNEFDDGGVSLTQFIESQTNRKLSSGAKESLDLLINTYGIADVEDAANLMSDMAVTQPVPYIRKILSNRGKS